jgi:2'-5' RNA ligase
VRTFIAIDLEQPLKQALLELIEILRRTRADVRWVSAPGMHLTLKFLGETGQEGVAAVSEALGRIAARHRSFPLVLEGTGSFPPGRPPRVLWVGVRSQPALLLLQEGIDRDLEKMGFPAEERAFHPHLTLGRVKGPAFLREASTELGKREHSVFGEMEARKVTFFESQLGPGGARYRVISEHPLS